MFELIKLDEIIGLKAQLVVVPDIVMNNFTKPQRAVFAKSLSAKSMNSISARVMLVSGFQRKCTSIGLMPSKGGSANSLFSHT